jgi:hypothetical protein
MATDCAIPAFDRVPYPGAAPLADGVPGGVHTTASEQIRRIAAKVHFIERTLTAVGDAAPEDASLCLASLRRFGVLFRLLAGIPLATAERDAVAARRLLDSLACVIPHGHDGSAVRWGFQHLAIDAAYDAAVTCRIDAGIPLADDSDSGERVSAHSASACLHRIARKLCLIELTLTFVIALESADGIPGADYQTVVSFDPVLRFLAQRPIAAAEYESLRMSGVIDLLVGRPLPTGSADDARWAFEAAVVDRVLASAWRLVESQVPRSLRIFSPRC